MTCRFLAAVAILLTAAPASASPWDRLFRVEDKVFAVAAPTAIALSALDAYGTKACVDRRECAEANLLLAPFVERHGIGPAMATKVAIDAGLIVGMAWLRHRFPEHGKSTAAAAITMVAVRGYVVYRNHRTVEAARQAAGR